MPFTETVTGFRVEKKRKLVFPVIFNSVYFKGDNSNVEFNSRDLLRILNNAV